MRSVNSESRPSHGQFPLRNTSAGGGSGSGQTSASQDSRTFSVRRRGFCAVTKTLGLGMGGFLGGRCGQTISPLIQARPRAHIKGPFSAVRKAGILGGWTRPPTPMCSPPPRSCIVTFVPRRCTNGRPCPQLLGCRYYLKHENHTPTTAFKVRGGIHLIARLPEEQKRRGVIGCTTGNHGQSLAYACRLFEVRCVLVVPANNNPDKNRGHARLAARRLIEHGRDFDEAVPIARPSANARVCVTSIPPTNPT